MTAMISQDCSWDKDGILLWLLSLSFAFVVAVTSCWRAQEIVKLLSLP